MARFRKRKVLAKMFALRSMGIKLVPSPFMADLCWLQGRQKYSLPVFKYDKIMSSGKLNEFLYKVLGKI